MKATLGVGISVLSALAAQGKDFDRTELNAMLDRLAASPGPRVKCAAAAMCYSPAPQEGNIEPPLPRRLTDGRQTLRPKVSSDPQRGQEGKSVVDRAFCWFEQVQNADGSWGTNTASDTAFVLLAFFSHGELPAQGRFGDAICRGCEFLIAQARSGEVVDLDVSAAVWALANAYGLTRNPNAHEAALLLARRMERLPCSDFKTALMRLRGIKSLWFMRKDETDESVKWKEGVVRWIRQNAVKEDELAFRCLALMLVDGVNSKDARQLLGQMRMWRPGERSVMDEYAVAQCKFLAGMAPSPEQDDILSWLEWNRAFRARLKTLDCKLWESRDSDAVMTTALSILTLPPPGRNLPMSFPSGREGKESRSDVQVEVDI